MYAINLSTVYRIIIGAVILWSAIGVLIKRVDKPWARKIWKAINLVGVLVAIYGILSYTVLHRMPSDTHQFTFFAPYTNEFYREMVMNAFLYYPFGLTLSTFIGPWTILVGFITSLTIELWQYFAGTGLAQGTDVIMNTLGAAIGTIPWVIVRYGVVEKVVILLKKIAGSIKK